jgi:hypothetical protein
VRFQTDYHFPLHIFPYSLDGVLTERINCAD